ncbi:MAG TPA: GvpL/GvpF family gas vesicle protein [Gemmatimonadaceae bacterium]
MDRSLTGTGTGLVEAPPPVTVPNDESIGSERRVNAFWKGQRRDGHDAIALCGIVAREGRPAPNVTGAESVNYRDVSAVVRKAEFTRTEPTEVSIAAYREVVEGAFACGAVIPAPYGTIFRSRDALLRWMELHYFTLADALRFLHDRQVARVRVAPAALGPGWDTVEHRARGADLEVTAFESFRVLKRQAVAYVPIEVPGRRTESGAEAAFLVERDHWGQFMALLKEEQRRLPDLKIEHSGPWPAYDFVRLDFNG